MILNWKNLKAHNLFFAFLLSLLIASSAQAVCDTIIDGKEHCDFDVTDYVGISTGDAPATSNSGKGRIYFNSTDGKLKCSEDGGAYGNCVGGGGGSAITLDLADDSSNESTDLTEIATTGDTNNIFTEPSADKLLINIGQNWPNADTADALSSNPTDCAANEFADAIAANGNLTCNAIVDADVPDTITIDLAATATALAANGANCSAGSAPLGVDASGAAESCTDFEEESHCSEHDSADIDCSGETIVYADDSVNFEDINQDNTLAGNPAFLVDECYFTKTAAGGGFICEGSTADNNEQLYLFPDDNSADASGRIVVDATQVTDVEGNGLTIVGGVLGWTDGYAFGGGTTGSASVTFYVPLMGGDPSTASAIATTQVMPVDCTLQNMRCGTQTAPTPGNWTCEAIVGGAPGALDCNIPTGGAKTCADTTETDAVTAGDTVGVRMTAAASPAATGGFYWSFECVPD